MRVHLVADVSARASRYACACKLYWSGRRAGVLGTSIRSRSVHRRLRPAMPLDRLVVSPAGSLPMCPDSRSIAHRR